MRNPAPVTPTPGLKTPQVINPVPGELRVAPWSIVTVAFGPPTAPLQTKAGIWHAVHWNKLREMVRPFGFAEVEGSAQILGHGDGSIISFRVKGEPKLPPIVQDWLQDIEPKGFAAATKIAKGAIAVLAAIAKAFGVKELGLIASGATVVLDAIRGAAKD